MNLTMLSVAFIGTGLAYVAYNTLHSKTTDTDAESLAKEAADLQDEENADTSARGISDQHLVPTEHEHHVTLDERARPPKRPLSQVLRERAAAQHNDGSGDKHADPEDLMENDNSHVVKEIPSTSFNNKSKKDRGQQYQYVSVFGDGSTHNVRGPESAKMMTKQLLLDAGIPARIAEEERWRAEEERWRAALQPKH